MKSFFSDLVFFLLSIVWAFYEVVSRHLVLLLAVTFGLGVALPRLWQGGLDVETALPICIATTAAISAAWWLLKYGVRRLAWLHSFWGEGEDP